MLNVENKSSSSPVPAEKPPDLLRKNRRWAGYVNLVSARMKEMWREPEVIFWVFVFPVLLALGLGIAFRNRPAEVTRIAVVEGAGARDAVNLLGNSSRKGSIRADLVPQSVAFNEFRLARVDLVVVPRTSGGVDFFYDPGRPESVLAHTVVDDAMQAAAGRKNPLPTSAKPLSEPGSRYIDFLIPGLLGMNLMNSGMWGIGFALVEMRQRKLLRRLVATPMRRGDFLLALASSRLVLMLIELVVLLGFGVLAFQMRVLGSWASILLVTTMGALCFGGLGLLTASRAQKIEAVSGLINVVMMPMWIFSGVFFSYDRFPALIQPFIKLLPLTALNDALRATILEGASLATQGTRMLVLFVWGALTYLLALRWFRWT